MRAESTGTETPPTPETPASDLRLLRLTHSEQIRSDGAASEILDARICDQPAAVAIDLTDGSIHLDLTTEDPPADTIDPWQEFAFDDEERQLWQGIGINEPAVAAAWRESEFTPFEAAALAGRDPLSAAQLRTVGFTVPEIAAWPASTPVDVVISLTDAGIDAQGMKVWRSYGIPARVITSWLRTTMLPADCGAWHACGFDSIRAVEWGACGFTPADASEWNAYIRDPGTARLWRHHGFSPRHAVAWRAKGFDQDRALRWRFARPEDAARWIADGWDPEPASAWHQAGFRRPTDANLWARNGFYPEDAAVERAAGRRPYRRATPSPDRRKHDDWRD